MAPRQPGDEVREPPEGLGTDMINFRSDNNASVDAPILEALIAEASKRDDAYGRDEVTAKLDEEWSAVFETAVHVIPVLSGTAANAISLAAVTPSYGTLLCHRQAHIVEAEVNAAGFFQPGLAISSFEGAHGKISASALQAALENSPWKSWNRSQPAALSVTQATELGSVYEPAELGELTDIARRYELCVHMDGARLANAIAHLGCTPAAATWRCGVDILSLGASKNGCMLGEAIVVFREQYIPKVRYKAKQSGQVAAKLRFVSAQLLAYCRGGRWLRSASRANAAAERLARGLAAIDRVQVATPPQANIVLATLPREVIDALRAGGFTFNDWDRNGTVRLVTSFDTSEEDIARLIQAVRTLVGRSVA